MKVKDLIEKLKEFDPELECACLDSEDYIRQYYEIIDNIWIDDVEMKCKVVMFGK
jgi:hypothetical protein